MKIKSLLLITLVLMVGLAGVAIYSNAKAPKRNTKPTLLLTIDSANSKIVDPVFATADNQGNIYVCDSGQEQVKVFSAQGRYLRSIGQNGPKLEYPCGVGLIDNDKVIIADVDAKGIFEYDRNGQYIKTWQKPSGKFGPEAIAVTKNKVYVTDLRGGRILVYTDNGTLINSITTHGIDLSFPLGIAVDKDGTLWVADGGNYNIKHITVTGKVLDVFDGGPQDPLGMAKGLAEDDQGRIYVADTLESTVRIFDSKGTPLFSLDNGQEHIFAQPNGIFIDKKGRIYVADQGNNKIQVWGWQ